jgi:hypothetical protein
MTSSWRRDFGNAGRLRAALTEAALSLFSVMNRCCVPAFISESMLLFWPAKIDLQHSTGPAQYGTIVDMQRGLTGSGLIERCKNAGRVYTTARLRTVFLSCRSSVVCGQAFSSTIVLKTAI